MMKENVTKLINYLETSKRPIHDFLLVFIIALLSRNLLETVSVGIGTYSLYAYFSHEVWYSSLALAIILLFHVVTGEKLGVIAKVVLPSFFLLLLAPAIDIPLTGGYQLDYIFPEYHGDLIHRYIAYGGEFDGVGFSFGQKIEVLVVLLLSFLYFMHKTASLLRSILGIFMLYTIIFLFGSMPYILKSLEVLGMPYTPGAHIIEPITDVILTFALFLLAALFFLANPNTFNATLKNFRPFRTMHYWLMLVFGIVLAAQPIEFSEYSVFFDFLFLSVSLVFAGFFCAFANDAADLKIDGISNKNRPLVNGSLALNEYAGTSFFFLVLSLTYALFAGPYTFLAIALIIIAYTLYSVPPFRLKRFTFFSKLVISFNSLLMVLAGFYFAAGSLNAFPLEIAFFLLVFFTACINFIDIKDYEGDRQAGINTLPVVLGLEKSRKCIGIFFVLTYLFFPFFVRMPILLPLTFVSGLLLYWAINRNPYDERLVFVIYESSIVGYFFLAVLI